jgi:hypothetical protein
MTVSQCRVSARKRWIWRREVAAVRSSQREGTCRDSVVLTVEVAVVVVPVAVFGLVFKAVAAVAAVAMPANASRSPQARIERRKSRTS